MSGMTDLRVSIITTTWNRIGYLRDAVDSVRGQTYTNYEHVFVDGGSDDGTLQFVKSLPGDVFLLENIQGGISRAMNAGLRAASGDVILHLHSDDYLAHPRVLARVVKVFQNTGCQWMYGRALSDVGGGWAPEANHFPRYSYTRLLQGDIIPHAATFVRRSLFLESGYFDEALLYAMDYDMWLRMGKISDPVQVPEFLSVFRAHSGSATYSNRMDSLKEEYAVRRRYVSSNPLTRFNHALRHLKRRHELARFLATQKVSLSRSDKEDVSL
jgi:glycosyltransferase involved in cell wall biosynthesis